MEHRIYKMRSGLPNEGQRKVMIRTGIMGAVIVLLVGGARVVLLDDPPWVMAITLALAAPAMFIGMRIGIKRQQAAWASQTFTVSQDTLIRRMAGFAELRIKRDEITALQTAANGGLAVRTNNFQRTMFVPAQVSDFEELRTLLSSWAPKVEQARPASSIWSLLAAPLGIAIFGLVAAANLSQQRAVVLATGITGALLLASNLALIWTSHNVPGWSKRYTLLLVPMLLSALYRVWSVW